MSRPLSPTERGVVERLRAAGYVVAPLSQVVETVLDTVLASVNEPRDSEEVVELGDQLVEALQGMGSSPSDTPSPEEVARG
jgi:hypothetical protein